MLNGELIDFEDFLIDDEEIGFEVYTTESMEADIRDLYRSFDALYQANKTNTYITSEYRAFKAWANPILKEGPALFGTDKQLAAWRARYAKAYSSANQKSGPVPEVYDKPFQVADVFSSPWVMIGGLVILAVVLNKLLK